MFKSLAKQLPHPLLCRLYHHVHLREQATRAAEAALRAGLPLMESLDFQRLKTSETIFVLGSAWSINDISEERWQIIGPARYLRYELLACASLYPPDCFPLKSWPTATTQLHMTHFCSFSNARYEAYTNTIKLVTDVRPFGPRQLLFELTGG